MKDKDVKAAAKEAADKAVADALRTLAHMARNRCDRHCDADDYAYLADIVEGKVKPL